ncbi:hypothetical protein ACWGCP_03530 [Streptomyces niveus]
MAESAPSVVDELARRIEHLTTTIDGRQVLLLTSIDHLTTEAGRAILAKNYAAYVAEFGTPA